MGGDATGRQSSGNYTIFTRPTIDIQAKIDRFVASGGVDFGLLNMKAKVSFHLQLILLTSSACHNVPRNGRDAEGTYWIYGQSPSVGGQAS